MARVSVTQSAFDGGELSSLLLARSDLDRYKASLFSCLNGIPTVQGPWTRRPGTAYITPVKFRDGLTRVVPFQFSTTQTYILEFGHGYIRVYTSHGILTKTPQSITSISKANPGVVTKNAHGYVNSMFLYLFGFTGMPELENRMVRVFNTTANTFELWEENTVAGGAQKIDTTNYTTFTSGQMAEVFELATVFTQADLAELRFTQSADTVYITHPNYSPYRLTRTGALAWSIAQVNFTDGPYDLVNTGATTIAASGLTGAVTLTLSSVNGVNNNQGWLSTDAQRLVRLQTGSTWGYVALAARVDSLNMTGTVLSALTTTAATSAWRLGIWSTTTGFPSVAAFHEDRLYFGNVPTFPQRFDGSRTSLYTNFSPSATDGTVNDSHAVSGNLNADDVNAIRWLSPHDKALLIGTTSAEWEVKATTLGQPITPTTISFRPVTRRGSADATAVIAGRATLFIQRASRKVREMVYAFDVDGYKTPDMTQLATHITQPSLLEIVYAEQPQPILWGRRGDGALLGFTYDRDSNSLGWHRHELGGQSSQDAGVHFSIPVVESVAVVLSPDATHSELYMVVQRWVKGQVRRYIEYLSPMWEEGNLQASAFFFDAGWTQIDSPGTNTVHGLWHLDGETVQVYVDGAKHPDVVVANGVATLNYTGVIKTVGYAYNSDGQSLPIDAGSQNGSGVAKQKKIARLGLWLLETLGLKVGPDENNLTELLNNNFGDTLGSPPSLFTGIVRDMFPGDFDRAPQYMWRANGPFPATVLASMIDVEEADDS